MNTDLLTDASRLSNLPTERRHNKVDANIVSKFSGMQLPVFSNFLLLDKSLKPSGMPASSAIQAKGSNRHTRELSSCTFQDFSPVYPLDVVESAKKLQVGILNLGWMVILLQVTP